MESRQPRAQRTAFKGLARGFDGAHRQLFHHHMRRHHDAGADRVVCGVQQGDGAAVRMAHQYRPLDAQLGQQRGQHLERLAVHVVGLQATAAAHIGARCRLAIALARIHHARPLQARAQLGGPVAPQRHTAQTFVQKHQRGEALGAGERHDLQGDALHVNGLVAVGIHGGPCGLRFTLEGVSESVV